MSAPVQYPAIKAGGAGQYNGPDTDGSVQVWGLTLDRGDGFIYVQNGDSQPYSRLGNKIVALVPVERDDGSNKHNAEVEYDADTGTYTFRSGLPSQWEERTLAGGTGYDVYTDAVTSPTGTVSGRFNFNGWRTPISQLSFTTPGGKFLVQRGEARLDFSETKAIQGGVIPIRDFNSGQIYSLRFEWTDVFHRFNFTFDGENYQATLADPWPVTLDNEPMTPGGALWGTFDLNPYAQTGEQFLLMAPDARTSRIATQEYINGLFGVDESADYNWQGQHEFRGVKPQLEIGELSTDYASMSADAGANGRVWIYTGNGSVNHVQRIQASQSGLQVIPQVITMGATSGYGSIRSPGTTGPMKFQTCDGIQLDQATNDITAVQLIVTAAGTVEVRDPAGEVDNGKLTAGELAFTQLLSGSVPISYASNQNVIDILKDDGATFLFRAQERDGFLMNVGASRYLNLYRDGSFSIGIGNETGYPQVTSADSTMLGIRGRATASNNPTSVAVFTDDNADDPEATAILIVGIGATPAAVNPVFFSVHGRSDGRGWIFVKDDIRAPGLPTSTAGLVPGQLWNDAGNVAVIPAAGAVQQGENVVALAPGDTAATIELVKNYYQDETLVDLQLTTNDVLLTLDFADTAGGRSGVLVIKMPNPAKDVSFLCAQGSVKWMGDEPQWHQADDEYVLVGWRFIGTICFLFGYMED